MTQTPKNRLKNDFKETLTQNMRIQPISCKKINPSHQKRPLIAIRQKHFSPQSSNFYESRNISYFSARQKLQRNQSNKKILLCVPRSR